MSKSTKAKKKKAPVARPSREEAEAAITTLIRWIGEDPAREGLQETPRRVVRAFEEYFAGYNMKPEDMLSRTFDEDMEGYNDPVLIRNIEVESRCEHHMAPFIGFAHVAYIPNGKVLGLSKIARVVDMYARRMQVQERLTAQIANAIHKFVKPRGVAVLIEAEHFCMKVRGVRKDRRFRLAREAGRFRRHDRPLQRRRLAEIVEAEFTKLVHHLAPVLIGEGVDIGSDLRGRRVGAGAEDRRGRRCRGQFLFRSLGRFAEQAIDRFLDAVNEAGTAQHGGRDDK